MLLSCPLLRPCLCATSSTSGSTQKSLITSQQQHRVQTCSSCHCRLPSARAGSCTLNHHPPGPLHPPRSSWTCWSTVRRWWSRAPCFRATRTRRTSAQPACATCWCPTSRPRCSTPCRSRTWPSARARCRQPGLRTVSSCSAAASTACWAPPARQPTRRRRRGRRWTRGQHGPKRWSASSAAGRCRASYSSWRGGRNGQTRRPAQRAARRVVSQVGTRRMSGCCGPCSWRQQHCRPSMRGLCWTRSCCCCSSAPQRGQQQQRTAARRSPTGAAAAACGRRRSSGSSSRSSRRCCRQPWRSGCQTLQGSCRWAAGTGRPYGSRCCGPATSCRRLLSSSRARLSCDRRGSARDGRRRQRLQRRQQQQRRAATTRTKQRWPSSGPGTTLQTTTQGAGATASCGHVLDEVGMHAAGLLGLVGMCAAGGFTGHVVCDCDFDHVAPAVGLPSWRSLTVC